MGRKVAEKCHHIVPGEKNGAVLLLGGGLRIQPVMAADEKFSGLLGDPVYIFAGEGDLPLKLDLVAVFFHIDDQLGLIVAA